MTELQVGFIPLLDCAPLAVAKEKGFAAAEGLSLSLVRESSWANIRDRIVVGHFDAAHMLGPMTVASTLGIRHIAVPVIAPMALGYGGNAITVSMALDIELQRQQAELEHRSGAGSAARLAGEALRRVVATRAREGRPSLTFGMVYPFSCHNYELRYWLAASGIDPDRDARLVVIPPPLLVDAMRSGHIDGFCVGEPWNSVAVDAGVGAIVLPTTAIWRYSPEKVLGMRGDFAERRPAVVTALLRAVWRATRWCAAESNRAELARLLSHPKYVGAPTELLDRALANRLAVRRGAPPAPLPEFHEPVAQAATFPWVSHALWFYSQMVRWGQTEWSEGQLALVRSAYRPDLYREALADLDHSIPVADSRVEGRGEVVATSHGRLSFDGDGFFDGRVFDPRELLSYATAPAAGAA